jgi:hypothetical protein
MLRQATRVLIAFLVALGLAMPAGAIAMPMPGTTMSMGTAKAIDRPCQHCPQPHQPGSASPDKMPTCQALACISASAVLPSPMLLPGRMLLGTAYVSAVPARLAGAAPAPDPFPPRPIVLL